MTIQSELRATAIRNKAGLPGMCQPNGAAGDWPRLYVLPE
jgi:hypothetical protein